jgi:hypothetical protein
MEMPDGPIDEQIVDLYLERTTDRASRPGSAIELVVPSPRAPVPARPVGMPSFGPPPCPACCEPGYLEFIDMARNAQSNRCRACGW